MVTKKHEYVHIEESELFTGHVESLGVSFEDVPQQLKELNRLRRTKNSTFIEAKNIAKDILEDIEYLTFCFLKSKEKLTQPTAAKKKKPAPKKKSAAKKPKKKPNLKSLRANLKQAKQKLKK